MMSLFHPGVAALAFFQSTQLNLFERFLTQAVSGIDSTSITSGMQNVAYVVLLIGFLWQVYQAAMHGGDVRGLGTNLIKYAVTAIVVMNYHAIFTTINQGFVNGGNWVNSASGATNLLDNWASDLKTQYSQVGFQNLWGLVTGSTAGILDAALIIVAYILYPVVIAIFGFFYILYGSILYIFGPIVIALMPLGATNRLAKSYAENVFIWNAWPVLYGGFGALLSAVQMGQVGQMLNQNDFLGGLGNLEGSILIGLASIIYSLAIAVIPFIAKKIVSGDVGATAGTLLGAAATALTMGVAATEGAIAGASGGASATQNQAGGTTGKSAGSVTGGLGSTVGANQPAPQQRTTPSSAESKGTQVTANSAPTAGERQAAMIRGDLSDATKGKASPQTAGPPTSAPESSTNTHPDASRDTQDSSAHRDESGPVQPERTNSKNASKSNGPSSQLMRPHGLASWGAYHAARLATQASISNTVKSAASSLASPDETAGKVGGKAGLIVGSAVNAAEKTASAAGKVATAATHPRETIATGVQAVRDAASSAVSNVSSAAQGSTNAIMSSFSEAYEKTRTGNKNGN